MVYMTPGVAVLYGAGLWDHSGSPSSGGPCAGK